MMSQAINMGDGNELLTFLMVVGLLLVGGLVGGLSNYYLQSSFVASKKLGLGKELLIGLISATVLPCVLSLVSSNLLNTRYMSYLDMLRLLATTLLFTMAVPQIFRGIYFSASRPDPENLPLALVEVEILRAIERQEVAAADVPSLPHDIRLSPALLTARLDFLHGRGFVEIRVGSGNTDIWAVTKSGWQALNETLRKAVET